MVLTRSAPLSMLCVQPSLDPRFNTFFAVGDARFNTIFFAVGDARFNTNFFAVGDARFNTIFFDVGDPTRLNTIFFVL